MEAAIGDWFGDEGVRALIQEIAGAALFLFKTKSMTRGLVLFGPSNTGKTTIAEVLFGPQRSISNSRLQTCSAKTGSDIAAKAITGTLCRLIRAAG